MVVTLGFCFNRGTQLIQVYRVRINKIAACLQATVTTSRELHACDMSPVVETITSVSSSSILCESSVELVGSKREGGRYIHVVPVRLRYNLMTHHHIHICEYMAERKKEREREREREREVRLHVGICTRIWKRRAIRA